MRPTIGISAGDPAGVGLEVTLKAVPDFLSLASCILFTDRLHFDRDFQLVAQKHLPVRWIAAISEVSDEPALFLVDVPGAHGLIPRGEISLHAGKRALAYLEAVSDAAHRREVQAVVTAPVSKASIGGSFKGQTEFFAERSGVSEFAMAFFAPTFKVVLVTVHLSLQQAIEQLSTERYIRLISFVDKQLSRFGQRNSRIAVAAINPHAGEHGMFGHEDDQILRPAVEHCASQGIAVSGPHSADSLYYRAHCGEFDVVIAPYHDQGLIPIKLIAHGESTNVTLGLPYVRTSPDHGTAFAIAGMNRADPTGMSSAIRCALDLV